MKESEIKKRYMTVLEICNLFGISRRQFHNWRQTRKDWRDLGRAISKRGNQLYFPRRSVLIRVDRRIKELRKEIEGLESRRKEYE